MVSFPPEDTVVGKLTLDTPTLSFALTLTVKLPVLAVLYQTVVPDEYAYEELSDMDETEHVGLVVSFIDSH